jgi:cell division protein FtsZ
MARAAVRQALHHPLVGIDSLEQASGVLLHFTGGDDLTLFEISEAVEELRQTLSPEADIVFGATTEPAMTGRTQAILIVTGIGGRPVPTATQAVEQEAPEATMHAAVSPAERDLDLPAFLRRRVMLGTSSGGAG